MVEIFVILGHPEPGLLIFGLADGKTVRSVGAGDFDHVRQFLITIKGNDLIQAYGHNSLFCDPLAVSLIHTI